MPGPRGRWWYPNLKNFLKELLWTPLLPTRMLALTPLQTKSLRKEYLTNHMVKESEEHAASSQTSQATAKLQQKTQNPKEATQ